MKTTLRSNKIVVSAVAMTFVMILAIIFALQKTDSHTSDWTDVVCACNGAGGRAGPEVNASRAGPLMRDVMP